MISFENVFRLFLNNETHEAGFCSPHFHNNKIESNKQEYNKNLDKNDIKLQNLKFSLKR